MVADNPLDNITDEFEENPLDNITDEFEENPLDNITDAFDTPDHPVQPDHPDPLELLREHRQPAPQWLGPETRCSRALLKHFLSSDRVSFYPGAGGDHQLFSVFGKSGSLHCHVHADVGGIEDPGSIEGYEPFSVEDVSSSWLTPFEQPPGCDWKSGLETGRIAVLQRQDPFDEDHGPNFQCLLSVQVDAFWLYWNLWAKQGRAPFAVVLQDHGNNPARFGGEGQLFQMASQGGFPEFLLVGTNTHSWPGYDVVAGWAPGSGMWNDRRCLYGKVEAHNTKSEDAITRD